MKVQDVFTAAPQNRFDVIVCADCMFEIACLPSWRETRYRIYDHMFDAHPESVTGDH